MANYQDSQIRGIGNLENRTSDDLLELYNVRSCVVIEICNCHAAFDLQFFNAFVLLGDPIHYVRPKSIPRKKKDAALFHSLGSAQGCKGLVSFSIQLNIEVGDTTERILDNTKLVIAWDIPDSHEENVFSIAILPIGTPGILTLHEMVKPQSKSLCCTCRKAGVDPIQIISSFIRTPIKVTATMTPGKKSKIIVNLLEFDGCIPTNFS